MCLASPIALLGLPMMVSRMLSDRNTEWGWNLYYDMPLMPIVFIGALDGILRTTRATRWIMVKAAARRARRGVEPQAVDAAASDPASWVVVNRVVGGVLAVIAVAVTLSTSRFEQLDGYYHHDQFQSSSTWVAQVHDALSYVPSGVEVRATNNLVVPLADRDTVTLVGSNVDKGTWAAIDTTDPQCPIGPQAIPPYMAALVNEGFTIVKQVGPIVIMRQGG
jgi:Predicted membrane protein (DUF2079)